jgi:anti-sigma factor RsiW
MMDCRQFHQLHSALLDHTLTEAQASLAHHHLASCAGCSNRHASVLRAMLVFRNVSSIEPSRHFSARLSERLEQARMMGPELGERMLPPHLTLAWTGLGFAGAAAGVLLVAGIIVGIATGVARSPSEMVFPPVVAEASPQQPKFVAPRANTTPRGYALWSEVLQLEHTSPEPLDAEFHFAGYTGR